MVVRVWHFRRCDEGEGGRKARQLADQLAPHAARHGLSVRHGKKIIEVTPTAVNKGAAVLRVIDEAPSRYDLVVMAGDDLTDESMFAPDVPGWVSIHVGEGETSAQYQVPDPAALRALMARSLGEAE